MSALGLRDERGQLLLQKLFRFDANWLTAQSEVLEFWFEEVDGTVLRGNMKSDAAANFGPDLNGRVAGQYLNGDASNGKAPLCDASMQPDGRYLEYNFLAVEGQENLRRLILAIDNDRIDVFMSVNQANRLTATLMQDFGSCTPLAPDGP